MNGKYYKKGGNKMYISLDTLIHIGLSTIVWGACIISLLIQYWMRRK